MDRAASCEETQPGFGGLWLGRAKTKGQEAARLGGAPGLRGMELGLDKGGRRSGAGAGGQEGGHRDTWSAGW